MCIYTYTCAYYILIDHINSSIQARPSFWEPVFFIRTEPRAPQLIKAASGGTVRTSPDSREQIQQQQSSLLLSECGHFKHFDKLVNYEPQLPVLIDSYCNSKMSILLPRSGNGLHRDGFQCMCSCHQRIAHSLLVYRHAKRPLILQHDEKCNPHRLPSFARSFPVPLQTDAR